MSSHSSLPPPLLGQGESSTAGRLLVYNSPLAVSKTRPTQDIGMSCRTKRTMNDDSNFTLKKQKEIFAGSIYEVIRLSEEKIRSDLEKEFTSKMATLESNLKAALRGVNGQATGDKGKMKATTPSNPVRSGKAKPPSITDFLANMRKQRNTSGTPVLTARSVTPDTASDSGRASPDYKTADEGDVSPQQGRLTQEIGPLLHRLVDLVDKLEGTAPSHPTFKSKRRGRKSTVEEVVKTTKENESRSERNSLLAACRKLFKDEFGINCDDDFMGKPTANPVVVKAFEEYRYGSEAPDPDNLLFDFRHGARTVWNNEVVNILVAKLQANSSIQKPESYLVDLVEERYKRARISWSHGQPRTTDDGGSENPADVEDRVLREKDVQLKNARKRERRKTKYEQRMQTVVDTISCKEQENAPDVQHWVWLQEVLQTLGQDGTSSDESDREGDIETTYYPKMMPWRRNIENELRLVDDEYRRLGTAQVRRGAKPAKRQRRSGIPSSRGPVPQLPLAFYDEDWLMAKSDLFIRRTLKPPVLNFHWRDLTIQ